MIRTRLGGIVSDIAPDADSSATSSPGFAPRAFISGNSTGATAAMSAAFAPEMPETRTIAPSSTYDRPPFTCPIRPARKSTICFAMPVTSIRPPRKMKSGTASRIRCDIPSSIRPTTTDAGTPVVSTMKPSVARPNANAMGIPDSTIAPTPTTKNATRFQRPSPAKKDGTAIETASNAPTVAAAATTTIAA